MKSHPMKEMQEMLASLNLVEVAKRTGLSLRTLYRIRDTEDVGVQFDTYQRLHELAAMLSTHKRVPAGLIRRAIGYPAKRPRTPPRKPSG